MLERLSEIISEQLGVEKEKVVEKAVLKEDLGADSLDLFELVMAIEEEYDIEIPTEDLEQIDTVEDIIQYIKAHQ